MSRKYEYPKNWDEIAKAIKDAAGWKCEQCGVEHDRVIVRNIRHPERWRYAGINEQMEPPEPGHKLVVVELSVHHKGIDKEDGTPGDPDDKLDNRTENLICLCARCHLLEEVKAGAARKARETRVLNKRQRQLTAGQGELF